MRLRHLGREELEELEAQGRACILAFWHGRFLMMPYCYRRGRITILISRNRDGELIARTMSWFGHDATRGSSSRGGAAALKEVVKRLRDGWDVAFTPDGPRGPRFRVQPGVIQAARLSGAPIIPVGFSARPAVSFHSWDRFLLPLPFSRGTFSYGRSLEVPRDADGALMERLRVELEARMRALSGPAEGSPE